jgi:hypothetical protein
MAFISQDSVTIVWRSDTALSGSVRDSEGVHDVRWTLDGWSCTCREPGTCSHVLAIQAIARVAS